MPTNASEHEIPTRGGSLHVRVYAGEGPPFVLMHGFPDNAHIYDALAPLLASAGRGVVVFDFLGYGASKADADASFGFAQQLGDLRAVVEGLGLDKIIPVGHDAAGPAAINFAIDHPERVASVCLLNCLYAASPSVRVPELIGLFATDTLRPLSAAALREPAALEWVLRFQQKMFHDALPPARQARFLATMPETIIDNFRGPRSAAAAFEHMTSELFPEVDRNTARLPELRESTVPFRLLWGEHDPYLTSDSARELLPHLKNATLDVVSAGHWPQVDMPEEIARSMQAIR